MTYEHSNAICTLAYEVERFIKVRQYLKGVSPATVEWRGFSFKAFPRVLPVPHQSTPAWKAAIIVVRSKIERGKEILDWVPLDSSVFASTAYLPVTRTLYLRFHSGEVYCYFDFPPQAYRDFLASDSKGQYFSRNIRDHFRYQHLLHRAHG